VILCGSFNQFIPSGGKVVAFADWTVALPAAIAPSLKSAELATSAYGTKQTSYLSWRSAASEHRKLTFVLTANEDLNNKLKRQ